MNKDESKPRMLAAGSSVEFMTVEEHDGEDDESII